MKTKPATLFVLAAAASTLLTTGCKRETAPAAQRKASTPQRPAVTKVARVLYDRRGATGFTWQAGDTRSYTAEVAVAYGKPGEAAALDPGTQGMVVRGHYHIGVLAADRDTVTLAAAFADSEILRGGERSPVFENLFNSTPAVITLTTEGAVQWIEYPADLPADDRQALQTVFGWELQCRAGASSWTSTEELRDSGCKYLATYSASDDGSVSKTRTFVSGPQGPVQTLKSSRFQGKAGRCWLEFLRGGETASVSFNGQALGETHASVSFGKYEPTTLPPRFEALLRNPPEPGEFTAEPTAAASRRISVVQQIRMDALRKKFRGVPYPSVFDALQQVAGTGNHADSLQALHDFRDMLQVRPDLAPGVLKSLNSEISPQLSALVVHALELANTEATQNVLGEILTHPRDFSATVLAQTIVAAGGLGELKDPRIAGALDSIQSQFGNDQNEYPLDDAALFSLSRLAAANPDLREPLAGMLTPLLSGGNAEETSAALLALANGRLSTPEILGKAENLLTATDSQIRSAALSYFEQVPDLDANQVRSIAKLLNDPNANVQLQAVATLTAAQEHAPRPDNVAALEAIVVKKSASEDVRAAARHALARFSAPSANQ